MANLYGVANPIPQIVEGGAVSLPLSCPAGATTNVTNVTLKALDASGFYYPDIDFQLAFLLGATPPTALAVGAAIGAGAQFDFTAYPIALLVASATIIFVGRLVGPVSQAPWQGAGSVVHVQISPTGQAVTLNAPYTNFHTTLWRAPDQ